MQLKLAFDASISIWRINDQFSKQIPDNATLDHQTMIEQTTKALQSGNYRIEIINARPEGINCILRLDVFMDKIN